MCGPARMTALRGFDQWHLPLGATYEVVRAAVYWNSSFTPRHGATNCEDPNTDVVYSLSGYADLQQSILWTNDVWQSGHGLEWSRTAGPFTPRYYSSCDVTYDSRLLMMGGLSSTSVLLNDVWAMDGTGWVRQTATAPWGARAEHLVLVGYNELLEKEWCDVIGGYSVFSGVAGSSRQTNDVWVSSDEGVTWARVTASAPWSARWGHGGVYTYAGVLLVVGGVHNEAAQASVNQATCGPPSTEE